MSSCLFSYNWCLQKEKHLNNLKEEVVSFSPFPLSSWLSWLWRGHWRVGCWSSPHGGPRLPPYLPTHQSTTPHPSTSLTATYTHTHTPTNPYCCQSHKTTWHDRSWHLHWTNHWAQTAFANFRSWTFREQSRADPIFTAARLWEQVGTNQAPNFLWRINQPSLDSSLCRHSWFLSISR